MRAKPQITYPLIGALLGIGAPVGAFVMRFVAVPEVRQHPSHDLRANAFFYLYDLIGTSVVFATAGLIAGRRADRLLREEAFFQDLSEHDSLTGLYNERAFDEHYHRARERSVAAQWPLSILLLDVDHLKAINDELGHPAGNQALIHVANVLRRSKRAADLAARWGGDEFSILLEGADLPAAMRVAEGIVNDLRSTPIRLERTPTTVTATIGICCAVRPSPSSDLFAAADRALFAGKARGRNTIEAVSI